MEIQSQRSTTKADADHFIGDVWYDVIPMARVCRASA